MKEVLTFRELLDLLTDDVVDKAYVASRESHISVTPFKWYGLNDRSSLRVLLGG